MALPKDLGQGASGFHGDVAVRVRAALEAVEGAVELANELRTDFNALLVKLDADTGVNSTDYAATLSITAPAVAYP